jgi:hypothetical protein
MNLTDITFHNENPLHSRDLKNWRRDKERSLADRKQRIAAANDARRETRAAHARRDCGSAARSLPS